MCKQGELTFDKGEILKMENKKTDPEEEDEDDDGKQKEEFYCGSPGLVD